MLLICTSTLEGLDVKSLCMLSQQAVGVHPVPEGHTLLLVKNMHITEQHIRKIHTFVSIGMELHRYFAPTVISARIMLEAHQSV